MLRVRILTATVLGTLLVVMLLFASPLVAGLVFALIMIIGAWEWSAFLRIDSRAVRIAYVALLAGIAIWGERQLAATDPFMQLMVLTLIWWFVALCWVVLAPAHASPLGAALAGILVLVPAWLALVRIDAHWPRGGEWTLFILTLAFATDTGGFFAGSRFGRVRLAPRVSPGKTWEGVLGGLLLSTLVAFAGAAAFGVPVASMVPVCVAAAAFSVVGDLTESMFKRHAGVKDSGSIFPGHGGILDRIDSVMAGAPVLLLGLLQIEVLR
jgi:phosphatidate cytidylyltransferase